MNSDNSKNITEEQQFDSIPLLDNQDFLPSLSLVFAVLMAFLCVAGTVTNTLSLIIFAKASSRRRSINVLLCGLSASDLSLCILALPVFSLAQLQHLIPGLPPSLANHLLVFCYPLCLMAQTMSVWMLVGITIDRWLAVCYPFSIRIHCTVKRARLIVLSTFLFSLFYNLVRFWEYRIDSNGEIVGLLRDDYLFMLLYQNLATTLSQFLLPLCVLCPLNLQVARSILAARERRKNMLWTELSSVEASSREQSTAAMMLVVVLVFVFCYFLSLCLNVLEMFIPRLFRSSTGFLLNDINNILVLINSASSALFYARFSSRYRAHLISLLRNFKFLDCLLPPPKVSSFGGAETPSCVFSGIGLRQQNSYNINRQKMSSTFLTVASCNNNNNDYGGGGVTKQQQQQKRLRANSANPCPL